MLVLSHSSKVLLYTTVPSFIVLLSPFLLPQPAQTLLTALAHQQDLPQVSMSSIHPPPSPFLNSSFSLSPSFPFLVSPSRSPVSPSTLILFLSSFLCPPPSFCHRLLFPSPLCICPSSTSPLPSSGRGCPVQATCDGGAPGQVLAGSPSLPSSTSPLGEEKTSWPPTLHSVTPLSGRSAARTGRSEERGVGRINYKTSQQN